MFHCPVGVWVIEQHAIILSATVRSPTVILSYIGTPGYLQHIDWEINSIYYSYLPGIAIIPQW